MKWTQAHLDDLHSLLTRYPVFPGDTVSHGTMRDLGDAGYAVRNANGDWIPTAKAAHEAWRIESRGNEEDARRSFG